MQKETLLKPTRNQETAQEKNAEHDLRPDEYHAPHRGKGSTKKKKRDGNQTRDGSKEKNLKKVNHKPVQEPRHLQRKSSIAIKKVRGRRSVETGQNQSAKNQKTEKKNKVKETSNRLNLPGGERKPKKNRALSPVSRSSEGKV